MHIHLLAGRLVHHVTVAAKGYLKKNLFHFRTAIHSQIKVAITVYFRDASDTLMQQVRNLRETFIFLNLQLKIFVSQHFSRKKKRYNHWNHNGNSLLRYRRRTKATSWGPKIFNVVIVSGWMKRNPKFVNFFNLYYRWHPNVNSTKKSICSIVFVRK